MNIGQHSAIVNSFNAVDKETGNVIESDSFGFISPAVETVLVFPSPLNPKCTEVALDSVVVTSTSTPVKLVINGNEMYPFIVDTNTTKGIDYMKVKTIKVVSGENFRIEGLTNE